MVLLNTGPNDYHRLFVLVVETLSTVPLNSGNWFWRELCFFHDFVKKMLRLIFFRMVNLPTAKQRIFNCCI